MTITAQDLVKTIFDAGLIVNRINGTFGAEIEGVDLGKPLSPAQIGGLEAALSQYRVLVFQNQNDVPPRQLLEFASHFGKPETAPHPSHPDFKGVPGVKVLESDTATYPKGVFDSWHTDGATRKNSRYISVLQAIDVPEFGRDTMFADMVTAFDRLSSPIKALLEQLTGVHSWGRQKPDVPPVEHPLVLADRLSGLKALYANKIYTVGIKELRDDEAAALLAFLFAQARIPEFQLRLRWKPGTIAMWNNELTQHYLVLDQSYARVMHRVMVS